MSFFSGRAIHPQQARLGFRARTLVNFLWCILVCSGIVAALSFVIPFWAADAIAIGAMVYWYVIFLNKRPIKIRCLSCRKLLLSNTPWVCGFCGGKNQNSDDFPFVHQCEHCSAQPKAYKCHHAACGELIYLSDDKSDENFAYCLNTRFVIDSARLRTLRTSEMQEKDHELAIADREAKIDDLTRIRNREDTRLARLRALNDEIEVEGLEAKLASIRRQRENAAKSILDQKKDSLKRSYDEALAVREAAEELLKRALKKYKNNPEMQELSKEAIRHWSEKEI